jgi:hypothetical protein
MAFFLLPGRVYEFSLGALCVPLYPYLSKKSGWLPDVLATAAISILVSSFFWLTEGTGPIFFGFYSLPALFSTCIIILFPETWINQQILCHPISTFVGKLSYTLYLVHWPFWIFLIFEQQVMRRSHLRHVQMGDVAFILTMIFGRVQFSVIESRFRFQKQVPLKAVKRMALIIACVAGFALFLIRETLPYNDGSTVSMSSSSSNDIYRALNESSFQDLSASNLYRSSGLETLHESAGSINSMHQLCDSLLSNFSLGGSFRGACILGEHSRYPSAILVGDSMMWTLTHAFDYAGRKLGMFFASFAAAGCQQKMGYYNGSLAIKEGCHYVYSNISAALPSVPQGTTMFFSQYCYNRCRMDHEKIQCFANCLLVDS